MSERITPQGATSWIDDLLYCGSFYVHRGSAVTPAAANAWEALGQAIRSRKLTAATVGFELDQMSVNMHARLVAEFPKMKVVDVSAVLGHARKVKTAEERRRIARACEITVEAIDAGIAVAHAGVQESDRRGCRLRENRGVRRPCALRPARDR